MQYFIFWFLDDDDDDDDNAAAADDDDRGSPVDAGYDDDSGRVAGISLHKESIYYNKMALFIIFPYFFLL